MGSGADAGPGPIGLRARPTEPVSAVVADVAWVNGLAAVRSLGRAGVRVLALDHRRSALGFRSRYAVPLLTPDPVEREERFVAFLAGLGDMLDDAPPLLATHDEHLNAVARHRDRLGDRFRYTFPPWNVLERIQRKRHQLETAEREGVAVPRTVHPRSAAAAVAAAAEIGYPVMLKPSDPIRFKQAHDRQAFHCCGPADVEAGYAAMEGDEPMLQEHVPGGDDELYTLGCYVAPDGEPLGVFCGRKLLQTRRHMGTARVAEARWVDEVVDGGLRLLRALGFHGIAQVEFKRDPRDGSYKLMEVNPRLWLWHGLAAACGVDLPLIAYRDALGRRPQPGRMDGRELRWAITVMAGARPWVVAVRPPYVEAVAAADDPLPGVVHAARVARRARSLRLGRPV